MTAQRHALAVVAVIVALGIAVVLTHGGPVQEHMVGAAGAEHSNGGPAALVSVCVAVLEVGTAGAALLGGWLLLARGAVSRARGRPARLVSTATGRRTPLSRARAGPCVLQVYRL